MTSFEAIFFWMTAVLLAASFFMMLLSVIFKKSVIYFVSQLFLYFSFITLTVFGITRWLNSGHPPFVTLFESMITSVWFIILIYLIIRFINSKVSIILLPVSLICFLMIGWSSSFTTEASPLSATLTNVWLFIHASFATSGAAAFLIGSSFSVLYLLGDEKMKSMEKIASRVPEYNKIPGTILNFLIFGLILWGVMIVSGSIWAHVAWGRYWAWDPIELWSLISWLLFGLVIHIRLTIKINPKFFCYLTIIAALTVVFSLWGVGYIYETIHEYG